MVKRLENQFNGKIRNAGLILGFRGLALVFSSAYVSEIPQKGFYEAQRMIANCYQEQINK